MTDVVQAIEPRIIFFVETSDGIQLVRAASTAKARKFVVDGYVSSIRKATATDMEKVAAANNNTLAVFEA